MLNFLKNWFGKESDSAVEVAETVPAHVPQHPAAPVPPRRFARPSPARDVEKDVVYLSLRSTVMILPAELQGRVSQTADVETEISIPLATILSQLNTGKVKITFGELRRISPIGTFAQQADKDALLVPLPLGEIFPQLDPTLLHRRATQRDIAPPEEITGPFADKGKGVSIYDEPAPQPARFVPPQTNFQALFPAAPVPDAIPAPYNFQPQAVEDPGNDFFVPFQRNPVPETIPMANGFRGFTKKPAGEALQAAVAPSTPASQPAVAGGVLTIPLAELAGAWPDAVRAEIVQANMVASRIAVPEALLERGLKLGKIAFAWRELRAWIQPVRPNHVSINDAVVVELPLKVIAPLFIAKQKAGRPNKTVVDEQLQEIPSLFFATAAAEVPPPAPKLEDTNYYVWKDNDDRPDASELNVKPSKVPGFPAVPDTAFLRRYATPNEIVSKAAALDGVAGALIALPDGLLVASRIPSDMNADTIAAFLPQIFGRVNQSAKELRMGDLNNLNFTVGNTPWKIFRVGAIYFAAFGTVGEPLPSAQLAGLAAELDRKPK